MRGVKLTEQQAKLKGAPKQNPQRYRGKVVPKNPHKIGNPPPYMLDPGYELPEAKKIWFELINNALPGTLTAAERPTLEALSNLMAEYRMSPIAFRSSNYAVMMGMMNKLGMNPIDRQRLGVEKPKEQEENAFSDFGKPKGTA